MFSVVDSRKGHRRGRGPGLQPQGVLPLEERSEDVTTVLLSEGNEVKWEGPWGVGVPRKYL
jgi:hypothetical protein